MNRRPNSVVVAGLAIPVTGGLALAPPSRAENGHDQSRNGTPPPPRIEFQYRPQWIDGSGTNVSRLRQDQRPAFDMFDQPLARLSLRQRRLGPFGFMERTVLDRRCPARAFDAAPGSALRMAELPVRLGGEPRRWELRQQRPHDNRNGRSRYNRRYDHGARYDNNGNWRSAAATALSPPQFNLRRDPRWGTVPGTRVMIVRDCERPNVDRFRLGSMYHAEQAGDWYRSNRLNGPYMPMKARDIPIQFSNVPRQYGRSNPGNRLTNNRSRHGRPHRE